MSTLDGIRFPFDPAMEQARDMATMRTDAELEGLALLFAYRHAAPEDVGKALLALTRWLRPLLDEKYGTHADVAIITEWRRPECCPGCGSPTNNASGDRCFACLADESEVGR